MKNGLVTTADKDRLFFFEENHITGGKATILITVQQIIDFMRIWTRHPLDSTHEDWINEFCEIHNAKELYK